MKMFFAAVLSAFGFLAVMLPTATSAASPVDCHVYTFSAPTSKKVVTWHADEGKSNVKVPQAVAATIQQCMRLSGQAGRNAFTLVLVTLNGVPPQRTLSFVGCTEGGGGYFFHDSVAPKKNTKIRLQNWADNNNPLIRRYCN